MSPNYEQLSIRRANPNLYAYTLMSTMLFCMIISTIVNMLIFLYFKGLIDYLQNDPQLKNLTKQLSQVDLSLVINALKQIPFKEIKGILSHINEQEVLQFFEGVDNCIVKECYR